MRTNCGRAAKGHRSKVKLTPRLRQETPPCYSHGCLENRLMSSCDWHFHWCTRANVVWFPIQRNCWIPRKKHTFRNLVNQYATHPPANASFELRLLWLRGRVELGRSKRC